MKSLKIILFAAGVLIAGRGYSQSGGVQGILALSWEVSIPSSNNFLSKTSTEGGRIEYRKMLNPRISAGLGLSWNSFQQYVSNKTYSKNGTAITTDMVRQIYTAPITAIFHYYPAVGNKALKPYIGIGLGAQYAEQNAYLNVYEVSDYNWGFVARPEIGTLLRFNRAWAALVTFSYNVSTNKNKTFNTSSLQQFGINVGIAGLF